MYEIGQEEIDAVARVIRSKQLFRYRGGEGGECDRCEKALCELLDAKHALLVSTGTVALIADLVGLGIGPGDEVIVPAFTWLASPGAVLHVGAIPVLAEVDESLTLDPDDFERKITPRVKAVMPVHMGGRPSDMDRICAIARRHGIKVLEDTCQAVGGSYKGRRLATIGDAGAFSFNQFKNIACGEGGAVITNDRRVYERALIYHDMGCGFRDHAGELAEEVFLGCTFRAGEVMGAILNVQVGRLDSILRRLRERRDWIAEAIRTSGGPLRLSPSNDWAGDCGCSVGLIFESAEARRRVAQRAKELDERLSLGSPIDSGLHVYTNWTPLLEQRGGHVPAMNPFLHPANKGCRLKIDKDCCPRTLDILDRTGLLHLNLEMDRETCLAFAHTLCRAAKESPVAAGR
jgi:dTDP-4-amino-4,6-dideoxygalactose transaminase